MSWGININHFKLRPKTGWTSDRNPNCTTLPYGTIYDTQRRFEGGFYETLAIKAITYEVIKFLESVGNVNIADIGCGPGTVSYNLLNGLDQKCFKKLQSIFFVDFDVDLLKRAEQNIRGFADKESLEFHFLKHNLLQPLTIKTHLAFSRLLHHYFSPTQNEIVFQNIANIIPGGGRYIATIPIIKSDEERNRLGIFLKLASTLVKSKINYHTYSILEIIEIAAKYGLIISGNPTVEYFEYDPAVFAANSEEINEEAKDSLRKFYSDNRQIQQSVATFTFTKCSS